ncbi:isochorismatase family protein [Streptomyces gobiensis]|uniref:isochorismatase family protein n=1 Tax=Streptomyces gobiensis TaxID=2875706 RepID=UPI001E321203|nr:isochorismatase family protein [Streptomyces gobiensis]UGY94908.1 isochorismatase family protein [Streptomyces gobiensis]
MSLPSIDPYPLPDQRCLEHNRLSWQLDPDRAVLLIHDMQNYFLRAYTHGAPARRAIGNISSLIQTSRKARVPVIYTRQPPNQSRSRRGLLAELWGPGLGAEADDAEITARLRPAPEDTVLTKHRYSAFHGTGLAIRLRELGRDQLAVTGVYAHLGCLLTCADAFMADIKPFLVADATADFDADHHTWALRYAATRCAVVTLTADMTRALGVAGRTTRSAGGDRPCSDAPEAGTGPARHVPGTVDTGSPGSVDRGGDL